MPELPTLSSYGSGFGPLDAAPISRYATERDEILLKKTGELQYRLFLEKKKKTRFTDMMFSLIFELFL